MRLVNLAQNLGIPFVKSILMKKVANWVELIIDNTQNRRSWLTGLILVMVVLLIGAGSLYMLLNTEG